MLVKLYKENTACAEPLAKAKADVDLIQLKVILSNRIKQAQLQAVLPSEAEPSLSNKSPEEQLRSPGFIFFPTKAAHLFTLIIVPLIIYGLTIGKKHVKELDDWAKKGFQKT